MLKLYRVVIKILYNLKLTQYLQGEYKLFWVELEHWCKVSFFYECPNPCLVWPGTDIWVSCAAPLEEEFFKDGR